MTSPVRRLVSNDRARHAPAEQATGSALDDSGSVDLVAGMLDLEPAPEAPSQDAPPVPSVEGPPAAALPADEVVDAAQDAEEITSEEFPARRERVRTALSAPYRPEVVDVLTALAPVFRAAHIYPGMHVPPRQIAEAIGYMSRKTVALSDLIAREVDPLEVDHSWLRARLGYFVAEGVASTWVSAAIAREQLSPENRGRAPTPEEDLDRFASSASIALSVVKGKQFAAGGLSPAASVMGLVTTVHQLEIYRHFVVRVVPGAVVDLDAACNAIGIAVAGMVEDAVAKLRALIPAEAVPDLANELMAQGAKFVFDARETACQEVVAALFSMREQGGSEAHLNTILTGDGMQAGVPVDRITMLARTMFERTVGATAHAVVTMLGAGDGA